MNNIQSFLGSIELANTHKVMNHVLKNVDDNIEQYSLMELEQFILELKPNNPKAIITICYVLGKYAKWLSEQGLVPDDSFYQMVYSLDKKLLWKKAKPYAKKKFISNKQFKEIYHEVGVWEEYNSFYYQTLFKSIYEGIYNEDMSVIKNLRSADIDGNIILLHEDNGHSYKLKVTENLAVELEKLSKINVWERKNRFGDFEVQAKGLYPDSVFKIEDRNKGADRTFKHPYYARLRKISNEYIGYSVPPFQLYVSGIIHRISMELNNYNLTLEEAFSEDVYNKVGYRIISNELIRCNYEGSVSQFRYLVEGHLDSFSQ